MNRTRPSRPASRGVAARVLDRSRVEVEAVDVRAQEGLGDRKRGEALAAADVGHASVAGSLEPSDHVGHRREPVDRQLVGEGRPVDVSLAVAERPAVGDVWDPAAAPVGLGDVGQHAADAGEHVRERRHVRRVVGVGEHARVVGRERVAAGVGRRVGAVNFEQSGDGLLLEPLARVALGDPGSPCHLGVGERAVIGHRAVEAELGAEVDGEQLQRAERRAEQALGERLRAIGDTGTHRASPAIERSTAGIES
jgi:hypothetical protein